MEILFENISVTNSPNLWMNYSQVDSKDDWMIASHFRVGIILFWNYNIYELDIA